MAKTLNARSLAAAAAFRARLEELGATLVEPEWLGALQKHRVICREGHACCPKPASVQQGQGICRTCVGQDSAVAEAAFRVRIGELGAELLEPYVNRKTPVRARCAEGYECRPWPGWVAAGGGICRICTGQDPATSEAKFLARLSELAATPLYQAWSGAGKPHKVRCAAGHDCRPRPSDTIKGHGICNICARKDPATAEAAFHARLAALGATSLESKWMGVDLPHRVRCARGHLGQPRPTHVMSGTGVCNVCAHNGEWDAFYVVTSLRAVKFGITAGDARVRLRDHARQGFTEVQRLALGLAGSTAREAELAVMSSLAMAGEKPLRGREYFDISCLGLILDVADSWLSTAIPGLAVPIAWMQDALFAA